MTSAAIVLRSRENWRKKAVDRNREIRILRKRLARRDEQLEKLNKQIEGFGVEEKKRFPSYRP